MRLLLIVAILAAVGFVGYTAISSSSQPETTYVTAPVAKGRLQESVTSSGTVNAVVTVEVSSQLSGQIASLHADFNNEVRKGQVLAVIDQKSYEARLAEAEAALEKARAGVLTRKAELQRKREDLRKAQAMKAVFEAKLDSAQARLEAAEADLRRKELLRSDGTVAASTLDEVRATQRATAAEVREAEANLGAHAIDIAAARADIAREEAELANAQASVPEKEAALKLAAVELERTTIRSPIDGVVINRDVDEGQTVAASLEAPTLFTIAQDLSEMEVHARVDETDIGKIALGQAASFTVDAYPGRHFTGEVTQIRKAPEVVQNVVTYTVVIRTTNDGLLLLPGMTALVRIVVMQSEELLLVPSAALRYAPGGSAGDAGSGASVWRLRDGKPDAVEIETGPSDARNTALVGGLAEGDEVVVNEIVQQASRRIFGIRLGF